MASDGFQRPLGSVWELGGEGKGGFWGGREGREMEEEGRVYPHLVWETYIVKGRDMEG